MNVTKVIGDILIDSGWTIIQVQSEFTTSELIGSHVIRSRQVHQVTTVALYRLHVSAYFTYTKLLSRGEDQLNYKSKLFMDEASEQIMKTPEE